MTKILQKINDYTFEDFKQYCKNKKLDLDSYKWFFNRWTILDHESKLQKFIIKSGINTIVTVTGSLYLDKHYFKVKSKTLPLKNAFDEMITPDAQDFSISLDDLNNYWVLVTHARGVNTFKFKLNDKN